MNRKLLGLLMGLLTFCSFTFFAAGDASALGGEWLGCRIAPGSEFNFYPACSNSQAAYQYTVAFMVQNESQSSTYNWSIPAGYGTAIYSGCGSADNWCTLTVGRTTQDINMQVTLTQGGASETLNSTASIEPFCGTQYC
jgi:hypothetical protein